LNILFNHSQLGKNSTTLLRQNHLSGNNCNCAKQKNRNNGREKPHKSRSLLPAVSEISVADKDASDNHLNRKSPAKSSLRSLSKKVSNFFSSGVEGVGRDQYFMNARIKLKTNVRDCDKTHNRNEKCDTLPDFYQKWNYPPTLTINNPCNFAQTESNVNNVYNLVIAIKSHCAAKERRDAVRKTWGNTTWIKLHTNVNDAALLFLMGRCTTKKDTLSVKSEQEMHNDMLQWNFVDSFRNLTVKECLFLEFISTKCQASTHIFKGDDDIIMNPRNLVNLIDNTNDKNNMFIGSVLNGSPAIRDDWSKYYTPRSLYEKHSYPIYVSGGGYIMSTSIATKLYREIPYVRLIPIDDAFVGLLLKRINKRPTNNEQFMSWGTKKTHVQKCFWHDLITFHKRLPNQLYKSWLELAGTVESCHPSNRAEIKYNMIPNKDIIGNDMKTMRGYSIENCKDRCIKLIPAGCEGFVYFDNLCFFKSQSFGPMKDKQNANLYQLQRGNTTGVIEIGHWY